LFDEYLRATESELWASRRDLEAHLARPETIARYVAGELGNNLLFTYKTLAITGHVEALARVARDAFRRVLEEAGRADADVRVFLDDALRFHCSCLTNIFSENDREIVGRFTYDIPAYLAEPAKTAIAGSRRRPPIVYRFLLDDGQRDLIARSLRVFGNTPWGIGRMLTKVYVKKLLRRPTPVEAEAAA
jgi:hypothetical protein